MTPSPFSSTSPFTPSGNPVWDEIRQAHSALSPAAQRAVAMSGIPQRAAEAEAPAPLGTPPAQPEAQAQPLRPIASPSSLNVRGLGSLAAAAPSPAAPIASTEAAAHLGELNRVTAPPLAGPMAHTKADTGRSGIGQIHNPFLRGLATVGDAVGSSVIPNVLRFIPGTELHHRDVVGEAQENVANDTARATAEAGQEHSRAQAEALQHPAAEYEEGKEPAIDPANPQLGPQSYTFNKRDPSDRKFGGASMAAKPTNPEYEEGKEPAIDPEHPELGAQAYTYNKKDPTQRKFSGVSMAAKPVAEKPTIEKTADGSVISIAKDPKTGKTGYEVVYHGDPKVETELAEANGRRVLINKKDGAIIKDLGAAKTGGAEHGMTVAGDDGVVRFVPSGSSLPTGAHTAAGVNTANTPTALTRGAGEQGEIINRAGDALIQAIQAHRDKLGQLGSYWNQAVNQSPIADKTTSGLMSQIASFAALQPRLHGMRSHEAMREFEKMIGGVPKDPDALIEAVKAIQGTAGIVRDVAHGTPASGGNHEPTLDEINAEVERRRKAKGR